MTSPLEERRKVTTMREILFHGKRKDNGEWVEGFLYITHSGEYEIGRYDPKLKIERITFVVDPETVGQFTGLTDRNGKKIFEGDVLLLDDIKGFVNYGTGCFCVKMSNPDYLFRNNPAIDIVLNEYPGLEVIGNIHDNPELLEG